MSGQVPSDEQVIFETLVVIERWCGIPAEALKPDDELEKLRPGKKRVLGLMLRSTFEDAYAPSFDEVAFAETWKSPAVKTVLRAFWAVQLAFTD